MTTIKLACSRTQFNDLARALERVRSTSKTVTVEKAALQLLIIDHGRALKALLECSVDTKEAE